MGDTLWENGKISCFAKHLEWAHFSTEKKKLDLNTFSELSTCLSASLNWSQIEGYKKLIKRETQNDLKSI